MATSNGKISAKTKKYDNHSHTQTESEIDQDDSEDAKYERKLSRQVKNI